LDLIKISTYLYVLFFITAGVNHFLNPLFYDSLVPKFIPFPRQVHQLTGVIEIILPLFLLTKPDIKEVTAFGAALASYVYINKTELKDIPPTKSSQNWNSNMSTESRNLNISKWNKAIEKAKNWI